MTSAAGASESQIKRWAPDDPGREAVLRLVAGSEARLDDGAGRGSSSLSAGLERQGLSFDPVMSISRNGRHIAVAAGLASPGGSALVLLGPTDPPVREAIDLLRGFQSHAWAGDTTLLQALLPCDDTRSARIYRDAGFEYLAELIYCDCDVFRPTPATPKPLDIAYTTYTADRAAQFIAALDASYIGSLDCPGLSGLRDTRDVLLGHRHTGTHEPDLWFLAERGTQTVGVLLLTNAFDRSCLEVVYMGVAATERGGGFGGALLSLAIEVARRRGKAKLTLAVDSTNTHARRIYERWGFEEVTRRRAWIARRSV